LMILAIITAIALPLTADSLSRYRAHAAARQLSADLRFAQKHARSTGAREVIRFEASENRYSLSSAQPRKADGLYSIDIAAAPYFCQIASAQFGAGSDLTFDAYGFPTNGGTVSITCGGTSYQVQVIAESGAINEVRM